MERRTDVPRNSNPEPIKLIQDPQEIALIEARNGLLQFDAVLRMVDASSTGFKLRPSTVMELNRIAIMDLYSFAGNYRTGPVRIENTAHTPPPHEEVAKLVEEMCDYVNDNWGKSPVHLASYIMWRLNWIHPFFEGNGRTSRAVSYLVLCAKLGYRLPGSLTIPEQIVSNRQPYYAALDQADSAWEKACLDVSAMEDLMERMLAAQLVEIIDQAKGKT